MICQQELPSIEVVMEVLDGINYGQQFMSDDAIIPLKFEKDIYLKPDSLEQAHPSGVSSGYKMPPGNHCPK